MKTPRERYMLYVQGFGDGASIQAMKHPGAVSYERGYWDGLRARREAGGRFAESVGYRQAMVHLCESTEPAPPTQPAEPPAPTSYQDHETRNDLCFDDENEDALAFGLCGRRNDKTTDRSAVTCSPCRFLLSIQSATPTQQEEPPCPDAPAHAPMPETVSSGDTGARSTSSIPTTGPVISSPANADATTQIPTRITTSTLRTGEVARQEQDAVGVPQLQTDLDRRIETLLNEADGLCRPLMSGTERLAVDLASALRMVCQQLDDSEAAWERARTVAGRSLLSAIREAMSLLEMGHTRLAEESRCDECKALGILARALAVHKYGGDDAPTEKENP